MPFLILFVLIPLAEIFVFIKMSGLIGLGTSLMIALFTAVLGGFLVKYQGITVMMEGRTELMQGALPTRALFDGLCIVAAGATLITPGFLTDALGFALLVPPVRDALRERLKTSAVFTQFHSHTHHHTPDHDPDVIDVEYETLDERDRS